MKISPGRRSLAALASTALLLTACGRDPGSAASDGTPPGITDTEVEIGLSYPYSGPASAYGAIGNAVQAYFRYVNEEQGGVRMADGKTRNIVAINYDDGYSPPRAVENARRLVQQDQVFALFNTLGTPNNTAIWDYLNDQEVPHLFVATGASKWGIDPEEHPWTMGWQPTYPIEAALYADFLKREKPGARVAVLFQNDDFGKDYLDAFRTAIRGSGVTIVDERSFAVADPSVDSQVTNLFNSGADTFFNVATPKFAAQAIKKMGELGFSGTHLLTNVSASPAAVLRPAGLEYSEGIYSVAYYKDPSTRTYADDPAIQQYRARLAKYAPGANPDDPFHTFGFLAAETLVRALEGTEEPTREALMESARNLDFSSDLLLPGVRVKTDGFDDYFPIESIALEQFRSGAWEVVDEATSYEGRTGEFVGHEG